MPNRLIRVLALIIALGAVAPIAPAKADVTVIGDDAQDAFVGTGSLLLPGSMYDQGRGEAAECPGCSWRAVLQCEMTTAGSCRGPARLCGVDGKWLRIYLRRPGGPEIDLGAACFGPSGPVSRDDAEARIREVVREAVPSLDPTRQPASGVLPHLPVIFDARQPAGTSTSDHVIVDLPVALSVTPRWVWDFGDGARMVTDAPGGHWPDRSVSHIYSRAGVHDVTVQAVWTATYVVDGLGPLVVEEPVLQDARVPVRVGEGRAVLVR